jgi:putative endonuclease
VIFGKRTLPVAMLGRLGEQRAVWFYRIRGYRVVARNVRFTSGEIDLVTQRGSTLVVAEVKTRQSLAAGEGHLAVSRQKQERLVRLADEYVHREKLQNVQIRYDVLSLFWNGVRFLINHYPDAFRPVADPNRPWQWRVE